MDIFVAEREGEDKIYNPLNLDNQRLLWHGSGFSNYGGILSQGLRIAPPEAPVSGYRFGKGVYFADQFSLSQCYCRAYQSNGVGVLLLCQVALGSQMKSTGDCNIHSKFPNPKYHSTLGDSGAVPDPKCDIVKKVKMNGKEQTYTVPCGKVSGGASQFIVYNTNQIKMRYVIRVKI